MRPRRSTASQPASRREAGLFSYSKACLPALLPVMILVLVFMVWPPGTTRAAQAVPSVPPIIIASPFSSEEPQPPDITSKAALVLDADTGVVFYSKNADERLPMASTTKIMTAMLVLESLDLETKVTVSRNAHFQRGSVIGLQQGEVASVEQLLYGLLVFSGNDAAVALAEKTSGSVSKFVAEMNEKAQAMGLTNTYFKNPDGLNAYNHFSSCNDLATMALEAMQNPLFREMVETPVYDFPHPTHDTPRRLKSSNALLAKYDWIDGIKTGSTPYAGYCMVASGEQYGVSILVVLLGAADDATRWREVESLFDYGYSFSPKTLLAEPDRLLTQVPLGDPLGLQIQLAADQLLMTRLRQDEVATGTVTLPEYLALPIHAGDPLGSVEFALQGESLGSVDLYAGCAVYAPSIRDLLMHARNWYLPDFEISDRGERYPH